MSVSPTSLVRNNKVVPGLALTGLPIGLLITQQFIKPGSKEQTWDGS